MYVMPIHQECGLDLDVSISRRSRDVPGVSSRKSFESLGLV